jgi:hypothetical protein
MNKEAFAALKAKAAQAGRDDKAQGIQLVPFKSTRFQDLIQGLTYKQQQVLVSDYAAGYRGYRLDVKKLPGLFNDANPSKG